MNKTNIVKVRETFVRRNKGYMPIILYCVQSIANFFYLNIKMDELYKILPNKNNGSTSLSEVVDIFKYLGLDAKGYKVKSICDLTKINTPNIILVNTENGTNDFAIYYGYYNKKYLIGDPSWGLNLYSFFEFDAFWESKVVLEINV
ncbi:hypothetical protein SDC9_78346 [bioreactor metagenome]|uniref:Peptidase C39 domain-containing protein n=1 Tax=bioreactor metagenome TaxID=1076179 RepID=A0A644YTZ1_9ZZZZ